MASSRIVKLNKLIQVGIAVRNADKVAESWSKAFGFSNWETLERRGTDTKGRPWGAKLVLGRMGSMQYELIEPLEGKIAQSRLLDTYGEGIHHIKFTVEDVAKETAKLAGRSGFRVVWQDVDANTGNARLSYVEIPGGVTIELVGPTNNPGITKAVGGPDIVDLGEMLQVGIAVRDADTVVKEWASAFGFNEWNERDFTGVEADGSPWKNRLIITKLGSMAFEFMQPVQGRRTQAEFLDKHGDGIHHIAFRVADLAEATAKLSTRPGFKPVVAHPDRLSYIEIPGGFIIELWPMLT